MTRPLVDLDIAAAHLYLSVVELGSISKAAARHGVSQPSASQRLRKLERQVGIRLLGRSATGSVPTPEGEEFAERCRHILNSTDDLITEARQRGGRMQQTVSVAATAGAARHLLPAICAGAADSDHPLSISIDTARTLLVCDAVRQGRVDLGFVDGPLPPLSLSSQQVTVMPMEVVVSPRHRFARRRKPVSGAELAAARLVLREQGSGSRDVIEETLASVAGQPRWGPMVEATSVGAALATVALSDDLVAVLAAVDVAPEIRAGRLQTVPCQIDFQQPVRMVWTGTEPRSAGARRLKAVATALAD